jgi:hypothetical protein
MKIPERNGLKNLATESRYKKNDMAKREGGSINVGSKNCGKERRS